MWLKGVSVEGQGAGEMTKKRKWFCRECNGEVHRFNRRVKGRKTPASGYYCHTCETSDADELEIYEREDEGKEQGKT